MHDRRQSTRVSFPSPSKRARLNPVSVVFEPIAEPLSSVVGRPCKRAMHLAITTISRLRRHLLLTRSTFIPRSYSSRRTFTFRSIQIERIRNLERTLATATVPFSLFLCHFFFVADPSLPRQAGGRAGERASVQASHCALQDKNILYNGNTETVGVAF